MAASARSIHALHEHVGYVNVFSLSLRRNNKVLTFCCVPSPGLLSSYGTLQAYYETQLLQGETSFRISVIGALHSFLLVFLGFLAGPAYDAGFFRHLLVAGSVLVFAGTLAQSFCTQLWQLILAEGACVGIGCGCLGILSVAIPASWFKAKLPLANAIAASGSGVGG